MSLRQTFSRVDELVPVLAQRKKRAAALRRSSAKGAVEPSAHVYAGACERVGRALEPLGFRYARSYPRARRKGQRFVHEVAMSSSHHNVAGEYVSLRVVVSVWCKQFARWRAQQPAALSTWDRVAGTNLGYLLEPPGYVEWDLADPETRDAVVGEVIEALERSAEPYFALFEDHSALLAALRAGALTGLDPGTGVELLIWLGERDGAAAHARTVLDHNRALIPAFEAEWQRIERDGLHREYQYTNSGAALAYAVRAHGLPDPT